MSDADRRFRSTVPYYVAGRRRYPGGLIREVAGALALDGGARILDLGCGPGFLAIAFAPLVGEVVAMDPEPLMLAAAQEAARGKPGRIRFVPGGSGDLSPALGRFALVAMGRSFHWMDRDRTLAILDTMIEPGGGVALFRDSQPDGPENAWQKAWRATRDRFARERAAPVPADGKDHEAVLRRSAFSRVRRLTERYQRRTGIDELVARALSTSTTSPDVLGERRAEFEAEIRAGAAPYAEDGAVSELVEAEALLATRPERGA
jgi:SAM-dependent methyltransferase